MVEIIVRHNAIILLRLCISDKGNKAYTYVKRYRYNREPSRTTKELINDNRLGPDPRYEGKYAEKLGN